VTAGPEAGLLREHRAITLAIAGTFAIIGFETAAVAVSLPLAITDFGAIKLSGAVLSAYAVTCIAGMQSAAVLGTRLSLAWVHAIAVTAMTAGTAVTAWSPVAMAVVVGRGIEGFGAGMAMVAMYMVVSSAIPVPLRSRMFAVISTSWVVPSLTAPLIAGVLATYASWRWTFALVSVFALVLGLRSVVLLRPVPRDDTGPESVRTLLWGCLAVAGLVLLQWAWRGGDGLSAAVLLAGALGPVCVFVGAKRILPRGTFTGGPGLPGLIGTRAMVGASIVLGEAWIPLEMVRDGATAAVAGAFVCTGAVGWLLGALVQTRFPEDKPHVRAQVVCGAATLLIGSVLVCGLGTAREWLPLWVLAAVWFVCCLCGGFVYTSVAVLIFGRHVRSDHPSPPAALQSGEALASATMLGAAAVAFRLATQAVGEESAFVLVLSVPASAAALGALAVVRTVRQLREQAEQPGLA
jgi:MFS family permease